MRTHRLLILAVAAVVAALTGCTSGHDDPPARPRPSPRTVFLSAVHDAQFGSWREQAPQDSELTPFPPQWCRAAAAGHSVGWMLEGEGSDDLYPLGMDWGTRLEDAQELVVMGVAAYCPSHRSDAVQSLVDGVSDY